MVATTTVRTPTARTATGRPVLAVVLMALAVGMASTSILGPLMLGLMTYRTSPTTLNQLEGSDAAALVVIAPLALVTALLAARGHPAAPPLAAGIGVFALYTYTQVIIGQEYLRLPGTVERYFPLLLAVFIVAEATATLGWRSLPTELPSPSRRVEQAAAVALLLVAVFLVVGLHLRSVLAAWHDPARLTEYASSPTPFWMVKLMDLGIIVPAAVVTGIGLWQRTEWARRAAFLLLTGYTCLAVSLTAMGLIMIVSNDPDASPALAAGFGLFALVFVVLTALLYRPLFHAGRAGATARATRRQLVS